MQIKTIALAAAIGLVSSPVLAANCDTKGAQSLPIEQAVKAAQDLGYKDITKVELERGCYEFEGMDKEGKKPVEFKLNAASGELVSERRDVSKTLIPKSLQ